MGDIDITNDTFDDNSTDGNGTSTDLRSVSQISVLHVLVLAVLLVLVLCGNISVLVATIPNRKKSRMNFFIMNLATADLMVALFTILPDLAWKIAIEFHGPLFVCRLTRLLMTSAACGSPFALVALSIDRLDAIARPFRFSSNRQRQCVVQVAVGWFFAVVVNLPALAFVRIRIKRDYGRQCWMSLTPIGFKIYFNLMAVVIFFLPVLIIAICHVAIVFIIWAEGSSGLQSAGSRSNSGISRAKLKTIKMTCVIVTTFILCWMPYFLWNYLLVYGVLRPFPMIKSLTIVINQLGTLNAIANPIIFWIFTRRSPSDQSHSCLPCYQRSNDPYRRTSFNRGYLSQSNAHYRARMNHSGPLNNSTVGTCVPARHEELCLQEPLISPHCSSGQNNGKQEHYPRQSVMATTSLNVPD